MIFFFSPFDTKSVFHLKKISVFVKKCFYFCIRPVLHEKKTAKKNRKKKSFFFFYHKSQIFAYYTGKKRKKRFFFGIKHCLFFIKKRFHVILPKTQNDFVGVLLSHITRKKIILSLNLFFFCSFSDYVVLSFTLLM